MQVIKRPKLSTKVSSDASTQGLRAILEQPHEDKWYLGADTSRTLSTAADNYCLLELTINNIKYLLLPPRI